MKTSSSAWKRDPSVGIRCPSSACGPADDPAVARSATTRLRSLTTRVYSRWLTGWSGRFRPGRGGLWSGGLEPGRPGAGAAGRRAVCGRRGLRADVVAARRPVERRRAARAAGPGRLLPLGLRDAEQRGDGSGADDGRLAAGRRCRGAACSEAVRGMTGRLAGRRALVVGGGTRPSEEDDAPMDNGRAIAVAAARHGAAVAISDVDAMAAQATADLASSEGVPAHAFMADAADPLACARTVEWAPLSSAGWTVSSSTSVSAGGGSARHIGGRLGRGLQRQPPIALPHPQGGLAVVWRAWC